MINVNDLKNGMSIKYENNLYLVQDTQHVKPGKGAAFVKAKLKNVRTGANIEITFNSSIKVEQAHLSKKTMQYLYNTDDEYYFMDMNDYSQIEVNKDILGENVKYLKENLEVIIQFYESEIVGFILPEKISYKITNTEPAVKGNTSSGATKDAKLETGLTIKVPIFIEEGEEVVINTNDGKYVSRA